MDMLKNKNDPFGKKFFHNLPFVVNDEYYAAIITPVVHYCMGGLEINDQSMVISKSRNGPIKGLFACGELGGGVHGANRLGGSSLLGCVVYGRVAGESASKHLLEHLISGHTETGNKVSGNSVNQVSLKFGPNNNKVTMEISFGDQQSNDNNSTSKHENVSTHTNSNQSSPSSSETNDKAATTKVDKNKEYTVEEVAKHNTEKDCWVIVNGQVLDVTNFLPDHPGGKKAILIYAGREATEEFNMLHKPDVVEKYAPDCIIGKIKGGSVHSNPTSAIIERSSIKAKL